MPLGQQWDKQIAKTKKTVFQANCGAVGVLKTGNLIAYLQGNFDRKIGKGLKRAKWNFIAGNKWPANQTLDTPGLKAVKWFAAILYCNGPSKIAWKMDKICLTYFMLLHTVYAFSNLRAHLKHNFFKHQNRSSAANNCQRLTRKKMVDDTWHCSSQYWFHCSLEKKKTKFLNMVSSYYERSMSKKVEEIFPAFTAQETF